MLLLLSIVIGLAIWYFDEGIHSFSFLTDKDEIFNFLGTVLFISVLPIAIFYFATDKEKLKDKSKKLALLGFLPALVFLVYLLF
jgi:hypothetical protein